MNNEQKEQAKKVVLTFMLLANIDDEELCNNYIIKLNNMNVDDAIDTIIITLNDLLLIGSLKKDDVLANLDLLTKIDKEKYSTKESIMNRLNWLKSMNIEHPEMTLSENHELVLNAFDSFNELIGIKFDAYYTGGLMGYLATNHPLERYHGDLDLFINEEELETLYELVSQSEDFEFISNMDHKEKVGHEFKIQYKKSKMSIGLFLFERRENEIIIKEYFYKDKKQNNELLVNENHLSKEYAEIMFSNQIREHNGIPYKMQSLESIYNSKKDSRPKDIYDASIIKDSINLEIEQQLDILKDKNYKEKEKNADNSIVAKIEVKKNSNVKRY